MKSHLILLASAAAAAGLVTVSTAASADPGSFRTYPGVGSDTTQDVWNTLDDTIPTTDAPQLGSYDAFGSATIQTRAGGPTFTRPAGSGEGVKALSASVDPANHLYQGVNIANQVDWSRSSSGPAVPNVAGLKYMPFARDAVSVAYNVRTGDTTAPVVNLTKEDLKAIYSCAKTSIVVNGTVLAVHPKLPQVGSGTRSFFLKAIGSPTIDPGCSPTVGAENDGREIVADGDLIPFSAAQWTAQKTGAVANTLAADLKIANIDSKVPNPNAGATSLYGALDTAPTPGFGVFARDTYNVIPDAKVGTELETFLNQGANDATTLNKFGFGKLTYVGSKVDYLISGYSH